jgi:chromosome segregation and condensation protein ScpB
MYKPLKKKYNTLKQLQREMEENGVKIDKNEGWQLLTKKHKYTLLDGIITVKER